MIDKNKIEIHFRGGFSERKGMKHFSDIVQVDNLNIRTRNRIYTATEDLLKKYIKSKYEIVVYIYTEVFSLTRNDIPLNSEDFLDFANYYEDVDKQINNTLKILEYNEVFDFIEAIINLKTIFKDRIKVDEYVCKINQIFIDENVNYRIIDSIITDIISEEEIESIENSLNVPYKEVSSHFLKATELLYKNKDYSNSIKESISSVEAMCQIINKNKETLGKTLKNLNIDIHPALSKGFENIYGYTSDANGIRHANGIGEKESTFSEAKYMLISCSAFINYLKENFDAKAE